MKQGRVKFTVVSAAELESEDSGGPLRITRLLLFIAADESLTLAVRRRRGSDGTPGMVRTCGCCIVSVAIMWPNA